MNRYLRFMVIGLLLWLVSPAASAQQDRRVGDSRPISPDLFGIFFEDLSYAADGGLYAEMIQNRSFEYTPADRSGWNAFTAWKYLKWGYGYGEVTVKTNDPISPNNPHYVVLDIEEPGSGVGLSNAGYGGIPVKAGAQYYFSVFMRRLSREEVPVTVRVQGQKGQVYAEAHFTVGAGDWKKYTDTLTVTTTDEDAELVLIGKGTGRLAIDEVSLFPKNTFKHRRNGMRADLAQAIADLKPAFMRFPGGCLVHGDGLANMYRWKNTIGPVEQRKGQRNIWNYHQSAGLGFFEYFQFCEDIGAKPVPVVAAAVSCQNSGGSWRIGSTGQRALPMNKMKDYIQDILDLVEYANGPVTSEWGAKRAAAGHPEPFHLEYIGIGNEDKITPQFESRFKMIYEAVHKKYPGITLIGTVGPFHDGADYEKGWALADKIHIAMVDEHYYEDPAWFLNNQYRYDHYDRSKSKVYLGEYASRGNTLYNALCEAAYMTSLERNGDVVWMASYAPLLARVGHTSWNPDLIYFTKTEVFPTVNYDVQQLFSLNAGNRYYPDVIDFKYKDSAFAASCVTDSLGTVIIKIVNAGAKKNVAQLHMDAFGKLDPKAKLTVLTGNPRAKNTVKQPHHVMPRERDLQVKNKMTYEVPPYSLSVIRINTNERSF